MNDLQELYQQTILEHSRQPRNYGTLEKAMLVEEGYNPLCGDKVTVFVNLEHGKIQKIQFEGCGCAISMASASLMTQAVMGKSFSEVQHLFNYFQQVVKGEVLTPDKSLLGKLIILAGVKEFPMRVKCATLAWHALIAANQILTFTDEADKHIKRIIQDEKAIGFRLSMKKMGCTGYSYQPEVVKETPQDDIAFMTEQGLQVFIDAKYVHALKGTKVDYVNKTLGKMLEFNNPNAESACGCGESFNLKEEIHE